MSKNLVVPALCLAIGLSAAEPSKRMPDGKRWTTRNLNRSLPGAYCYNDSESECRAYGRLYTWDAAVRVCAALGGAWRLPTDDEWRHLARRYGGVVDDSKDRGNAAFRGLLQGGSSGFGAQLGGGRDAAGQYARKDAHGFYWTSTALDSSTAWFYNFAAGSHLLNRHDGEKQRALAVRCVRD